MSAIIYIFVFSENVDNINDSETIDNINSPVEEDDNSGFLFVTSFVTFYKLVISVSFIYLFPLRGVYIPTNI